jgi:type IV pilus assembly protein PilB
MQVHPRAGLTFATGLRALLRSDPDVVMVGEIRDAETAQIAIESALTGHLVMTTLHANNAPLAAARLLEMGIEPYLVTSSVECVVAQRLVRKLCDCKAPVKLSKAMLEENGFEVSRGISGFEPGGCVSCAQTGFKGRTGLYEVMTMSDEVRRLILDGARNDELTRVARAQGMRTLHEAGLAKVAQGVTSVPEVLRVLGASAAGR